MKKEDARRGLAVVQPFVSRYSAARREWFADEFGSDDSDAEDESWVIDRQRVGPSLVQLASLGRRVDMLELGAPNTFDVGTVHEGCGGPAPRACMLRPELFCAAAMVEVPVDLMKMTVLQLKDELAARGAPRTGQLKSVLRGRLRALIIAHHMAASYEE